MNIYNWRCFLQNHQTFNTTKMEHVYVSTDSYGTRSLEEAEELEKRLLEESRNLQTRLQEETKALSKRLTEESKNYLKHERRVLEQHDIKDVIPRVKALMLQHDSYFREALQKYDQQKNTDDMKDELIILICEENGKSTPNFVISCRKNESEDYTFGLFDTQYFKAFMLVIDFNHNYFDYQDNQYIVFEKEESSQSIEGIYIRRDVLKELIEY